MILRPRQQLFAKRSVEALSKRGNTLGIAPTGAGKTVMLSAIAGRGGPTALVLQHRDELVKQNEQTFRKVNPKIPTSFFTANYKRFGGPGSATFAMIQTLAHPKNLMDMEPIDLLVIDEAHHVAADTYIRVIEQARKLNKKLKVFGVTATPGRGDTRNLRAAFDNVADQITIDELIADGHLVKPRCFVMETVVESELAGVRKTALDFDMGEVESIMNTRVVNTKVVEEWRKAAGDRQTVVFASTVVHAESIADEFQRQGIRAHVITGEMRKQDRRDVLAAFDRAEFQVLVNVMVLTEGWDCQPVSCVVLLRPCSLKSTMIQMIGRGLRTVDPERYPGVVKDDCIVLDFGYSLHTHRDLTQRVMLDKDAPPIECGVCAATCPAGCMECPICGAVFRVPDEVEPPSGERPGVDETTELEHFVMTEFDLLAKSPFKWEDFFDGKVTVCNGLEAWSAVIFYRARWVAVGGATEAGIRLVADTHDRFIAMSAADDFMREFGDDKAARKSKSWINAVPTPKQLDSLGLGPMGAMGMSRYRASCMLQWKFMERAIQKRLARITQPSGVSA